MNTNGFGFGCGDLVAMSHAIQVVECSIELFKMGREFV
jgi:hypothetical protein